MYRPIPTTDSDASNRLSTFEMPGRKSSWAPILGQNSLIIDSSPPSPNSDQLQINNCTTNLKQLTPFQPKSLSFLDQIKTNQLRREEDAKTQTINKWMIGLLAIIVTLVLVIIFLIISDQIASGNRYSNLSPQTSHGIGPGGRILASNANHNRFSMGSNGYDMDPDNEQPADRTSNDDRDERDRHIPDIGGSGGFPEGDYNNVPYRSKYAHRHRPSSIEGNFKSTYFKSNKMRDSADSVCMSPGCVQAAASILANMDNQTEACDNFYRFACGRWIEKQVIPDEKTSLSIFSLNTADLNVKLRHLVEEKSTPDSPRIVVQIKNLYQSCMNISEIESKGDEPLLSVLRDLGGWPVLETSSQSNNNNNNNNQTNNMRPTRQTRSSSNSTSSSRKLTSTIKTNNSGQRSRSDRQQRTPTLSNSSSWLETIFMFRKRGFSHDMIIDLSVVVDIRDNKRYIVDLDQSSLGMPDRSYYYKPHNDTTVAAYIKLMVESATMLGAPLQEANIQMREAFEFETQLAKISISRENRRNVSRLYNKMAAKDLYQIAPNIDWRLYLLTLLADETFDMDTDQVVVKVPSFLRQLDELLQTTDPRIVKNYMIWRIVRHSMSGLGRKWRELAHSYNSATTGRQTEEPRWEVCLGSLEGTLATAMSAMYVKNYFNQASKEVALEMVQYIRQEFLAILEEIDWMDEETRREARLKAQAISAYIGYPDELLRDDLVEQFYSGLDIAPSNYYQNLRTLRIWSTNYAFNQLKKPNKRGDWRKHSRAAVVNAYYNALENSIEFPAGILRGAFFDADRPNYLNFGAIGYVIGHEITHGFDDRGRQYDKDGQDRFWWKPKTDARFRERAQCIVEQYGNFTVPETGLNVNGLNTQGENIADNGGIKEAFRAYKRWTKDNGIEQRLPGLDYSPDQLFWISAANIWCGKFRPEVLKLRVNSGVHSPSEFRIIGPLSNSPEFSKSFNCPIGSRMNPIKKCAVW